MLENPPKLFRFNEAHDVILFDWQEIAGISGKLRVFTCPCDDNLWSLEIDHPVHGIGNLLWICLKSQTRQANYTLLLDELKYHDAYFMASAEQTVKLMAESQASAVRH